MGTLGRNLRRSGCIVALAVATLWGAGFLAAAQTSGETRPNVLLITIDDLRNDTGFLGVAHAKTPHLDAFAEQARIFSHHYVQVPTCGASRAALMRGRYPTVSAHVGNNAVRDTHPNWAQESLPAWFKSHGYRTLSLGKITHYPGNLSGKNWNEPPEELPGAWDRAWIPESPWLHAEGMMHGYANGVPRTRGETPPLEAFDGPDTAYPDGLVARDAVETLRELAEAEQPWFFAVGFFKPHLPFSAPKRYFDLHNSADIPPAPVAKRPEAPTGWHGSGELRGNYRNDGRDPDADFEYAADLRRAYAASISYVDAQVGKVLDAAQALGILEDAIVVVWSDHGFLLGDHAIWGKHCLYDQALRAPLLIRTPDMERPGQTSAALVETVDLFPTLTDLCGLPAPAALDGRSLRPLLAAPAAVTVKPARSWWRDQRTLRTDRWRLIHHPGENGGVELFDLVSDPHESRNVAAEHPAVVEELLGELDQVPALQP